MQIVIFSFNRAIQLDALLQSVNSRWKKPSVQIYVLYNASSEVYQSGYDMLIEKYKNYDMVFCKEEASSEPGYNWKLYFDLVNLKALRRLKYIRHPKTNFRSLLLKLLQKDSSNEVMFLTDDSLFIRDVEVPQETFEWLHEAPEERQISLRLGRGINGESKYKIQDNNGTLIWNMRNIPGKNNWSYSFSVDAHIYDKATLLKLLEKTMFSNPNSLENDMWQRTVYGRYFYECMAPIKSVILSFPLNMVQTVEDNESLGISVGLLNDYYLQGYRLEYPIPEVYKTFQIYPKQVFLIKGEERKTLPEN